MHTLAFGGSPLVGERRERALRLLTEAERARFADDRQPERFLAGRMLLREIAAEVTGRALDDIRVTAACPDCGLEHGQPRVPGIHVSLSHAGDRLVAAADPDAAIGVDLEPRAVSAERLAAIREIAGGDDLAHWTAVEAVLKADGRGLRLDPRDVRVEGAVAILGDARYDLYDASDDDAVVTVATRRA